MRKIHSRETTDRASQLYCEYMCELPEILTLKTAPPPDIYQPLMKQSISS